MRTAAALLTAVVTMAVLTACSTGKDAVAQGGSSFQFVAPGGQTTIDYDVSKRQPVPEISGDSLMEPGKQVKLSEFTGKVVVVNIWAAWCSPCRAEAPKLQKMYDDNKAAGLQVMGVDVRDDKAAATDFYHNQSLTYPSIFDPSIRSLLVLQGYPRTSTPTTLVLDRQHRVAWVSLLPVDEQQLLGKVKQLLAEK